MRAHCLRPGRLGAMLLWFSVCALDVRASFAACALGDLLEGRQLASAPGHPEALAVADLTGDGSDDLIVCDPVAGTVSVYDAMPTGAAGSPQVFIRLVALSGLDRPQQCAIADFNSDGRLDLAVATFGAEGVGLFFGTVTGGRFGFGAPVWLPGSAGAIVVVAADLARDGILDLAVSCTSGVLVYIGQGTAGVGDGSFGTARQTLATTRWNALVAADMNGDQVVDLVGCTGSPNAISYLMGVGATNAGTGYFGLRQTVATAAAATTLMAADFNNDGRTDLALPCDNGGIAVAQNMTAPGGYTLSLPQFTFGSISQMPMLTAWTSQDLDHDGIRELIVQLSNGPDCRVLRGSVSANNYAANEQVTLPGSTRPSRMAIGDFDGDGLADLAGSDAQNGRLMLARGICSGLSATLAPFAVRSFGPGSVSAAPPGASQPLGSTVTVTATPDPGALFLGWNGSQVSTQNPASVLVTGATAMGGWFANAAHPLHTSALGEGFVHRKPELPAYPEGALIAMAASAAAHWHFTGWTGDHADTSQAMCLTADSEPSLVANFEIDQFDVRVDWDTYDGRDGTVVLDPPGGRYPYGTTVSMTFVPVPGCSFSGWYGLGEHYLENPFTFTVTGDMSFYAMVDLTTYMMELSTLGFGWVNLDVWPLRYDAEVHLEAVPWLGYEFVEWSGDVADTANPVAIRVRNDMHVTAVFSATAPARPRIASVQDVAFDQGGRVKVNWVPGEYDAARGPNSHDVVEYYMWRELPGDAASLASAEARVRSAGRARAAGPEVRRMYVAGAASYWEFVGSSPAAGMPGYGMVVPTEADATPSRPERWQRVMVQARSAEGDYQMWWNSRPDSGRSRDDLAPDAPAAGTLQWMPNEYELAWTPSIAVDVVGYRVYQGWTPLFVTDSSTFVAFTAEPRLRRTRVNGGVPLSRVRAVDVHENESAALEISPGVLDVEPGPARLRLALAGANPARGPLAFEYTTARGGDAELTLFDVAGRACFRRRLPAAVSGSAHVELPEACGWPAGLYFARLRQDDHALTVRVLITP